MEALSAMPELRVFFFQAEDGIRHLYVTGVQTCALPICAGQLEFCQRRGEDGRAETGHAPELVGAGRLLRESRQHSRCMLAELRRHGRIRLETEEREDVRRASQGSRAEAKQRVRARGERRRD